MQENQKKIEFQINTDTVSNACQTILRETQESVLFGLYLIQSNNDVSSFNIDSIGGSELSFRFEAMERDINTLKLKFKHFLLTKAFEDFIKAIDTSMQKAYECVLIKEWTSNKREIHIKESTTWGVLHNDIIRELKEYEKEAKNTDFKKCYKKVKNHLMNPLSLHDEISTIRRVRNCLVHGNGVVTEKHINDRQNNILKLKWISLRMIKVSNGKEGIFKIGGVLNPGDEIRVRRNREFIKSARKPQAFKPGDEWPPGAKPAKSWLSGGKSGMI